MNTLAEIDATGLAASKALDLAAASSTRNRATFRNYADILYTRIFDSFYPHRAKILSQLVEAASKPNTTIRTKIWDYNVTYRTDGNVAQVMDMVDFTNRGYHTVIVDDARPMSVDAVFRNSDITWRLAYTFGSKFRVSFVQEETRMISEEYSGYRIAVYLHYHPEGLLPYAEEKMIAAYNDVCDRNIHVGKDVHMLGRY